MLNYSSEKKVGQKPGQKMGQKGVSRKTQLHPSPLMHIIS